MGSLDEDQFSFRNLLGFVGPGMLVSIAYLDPGNCKYWDIYKRYLYTISTKLYLNSCYSSSNCVSIVLSDIQSGAAFNYRLIWVGNFRIFY